MYTKADFQEAIANSIANYPTIAPLYHAGDPRIRQHLDAMATMLAMFSSQLEVAQTEQYEKARDSTVLADAAMRGIIRKGRAPRAARSNPRKELEFNPFYCGHWPQRHRLGRAALAHRNGGGH